MAVLPWKSLTVWLVAVAVASLAVCREAVAQQADNQSQTSGSDTSGGSAETGLKPEVPEEVEVESVASDAQIEQRLKRVLTSSPWFQSAVVEVRDGVVFLSGVGDSDAHVEWATQLAQNTEDVVAVVNDMTVDDAVTYQQSLGIVLDSLKDLWQSFLERLPLLLSATVLLLITWGVSRIVVAVVRRLAEKSRLNTSLKDLLTQLAAITVWLAGILAAAVVTFPGMTPGKILTVLGLSSVALGFAFKDIFENFFAGVLILWRFPFDRGDFIRCEDIEGKVEDITVRMTNIRQTDGQLVVIPNAMLFKNPVDVMTSRKVRRVTVICGVGYGEDVDESREVIRKAVEACSTVDSDQPVQIFAQEFASSSINFEVTWWTGSTPVEIRESRDEVVAAVKRALDDAGIEIPFPYRTLTFSEPLKAVLDRSDRSTDKTEGNGHASQTAEVAAGSHA